MPQMNERAKKLGVLQMQVSRIQPKTKTQGFRKCQSCQKGNLHTLAVFDKRGPPAWYLGDSQNSNSCKS